MWHEVLAQGSGITEYAQPAGFIGVLVFIIRYFMVSLDKRDVVIERISNRSNEAIENNTKAMARMADSEREVVHAIRNAPCGSLLRARDNAVMAAKGEQT